MKTVAMALFPDFLLLDMAGPLEVFSIANRYLPPAPHYRMPIFSSAEGQFACKYSRFYINQAQEDPAVLIH